MRVGSCFSGIGGLDLGLHRAGHDIVWQAESDPYRRAILARNFPGVPCFDDVAAVAQEPLSPGEQQSLRVDLICGGFPCQDVSVAGRRAGLQGSRSGLFFEFARIAGTLRPAWLLIENVPGLLSSHGGRDFAVVLATLAELGYSYAWRIVDSRYFGVPQRRRRVFVVGHLGATGPETFLPFLESGPGHPSSRPQAGPDVASTLGNGAGKRGWRIDAESAGGGISLSGLGNGGPDDNDAQAGRLVTPWDAQRMRIHDPEEVGPTLGAEKGRGHGVPMVAATLSKGGNPNSNAPGRHHEDDENLICFNWQNAGNEGYSFSSGQADPLDRSQTKAVAISQNQRGELVETDYAHQLTSGGGKPGEGYAAVRDEMAVRRLTPTECCRLQGFPDDWFGEPNEAPDGPRYAGLGDAVTVNVAEWFGRKLAEASDDRRSSSAQEGAE